MCVAGNSNGDTMNLFNPLTTEIIVTGNSPSLGHPSVLSFLVVEKCDSEFDNGEKL